VSGFNKKKETPGSTQFEKKEGQCPIKGGVRGKKKETRGLSKTTGEWDSLSSR